VAAIDLICWLIGLKILIFFLCVLCDGTLHMIQYTDRKVVEQLKELFHQTTIGIIYAEEVLKKTQQVNSAVEVQVDKADLIKLEIAGIAIHTQDIEKNIQQWYVDIQNIHDDVIQTLSKITNQQNIDNLQQELQSTHNKISEFQEKIAEIDQDLPKYHTQLNQNLALIQQLSTHKK
jgi:uncharacterized coiled-coil DUF342 family protein